MLYCHLWHAPALKCFSTLSNTRTFKKKKKKKKKEEEEEEEVIEHKMCILISSRTFAWNISHNNKNWARYDQKCIVAFM